MNISYTFMKDHTPMIRYIISKSDQQGRKLTDHFKKSLGYDLHSP